MPQSSFRDDARQTGSSRRLKPSNNGRTRRCTRPLTASLVPRFAYSFARSSLRFQRRVSLIVVPSRDTWLRFILSGDEPKRRRNRAALPAKSRECCFQATAWTQTLSGLSGSARQKCSSHKVGQKLYFVPSSYLAHKALCQMFGVDYMGEQKSGSLPIM